MARVKSESIAALASLSLSQTLLPQKSPAYMQPSVRLAYYVAIIAGGGTAQDIVFSGLTPEIPNATGARTIWVFRLPP